MRNKVAQLLRRYNVKAGNAKGLKPEEINNEYKKDKKIWNTMSRNKRNEDIIKIKEYLNEQ